MLPTIETLSGAHVNLLNPTVEQIDIDDIGIGLARAARFNGHTNTEHPYSVAQHSVWCAYAAQEYFDASIHTTLCVLLHDAHEAYTGDIATPLKRFTPNLNYEIKSIEDRLQRMIHEALNIPLPCIEQRKVIKAVDQWALAVEAWHMVPSQGKGWALPIPPVMDEMLNDFTPALSASDAKIIFYTALTLLRDNHCLPKELWACK